MKARGRGGFDPKLAYPFYNLPKSLQSRSHLVLARIMPPPSILRSIWGASTIETALSFSGKEGIK